MSVKKEFRWNQTGDKEILENQAQYQSYVVEAAASRVLVEIMNHMEYVPGQLAKSQTPQTKQK